MYFGIVETESLQDTLLFKKYVPVKVIPQKVGNADTKLWHLNVLKIEDSQSEHAANSLALVMLYGWYAVIWNDNIFYVILPKKAVKLKRGDSASKEYQEMRAYAIEQGIQEQYLDFDKNFENYNKFTFGL